MGWVKLLKERRGGKITNKVNGNLKRSCSIQMIDTRKLLNGKISLSRMRAGGYKNGNNLLKFQCCHHQDTKSYNKGGERVDVKGI